MMRTVGDQSPRRVRLESKPGRRARWGLSITLVGALLGAGLLVMGASAKLVDRIPWGLESLEGRVLVLKIPMAGVASGCNGLDRVEVREISESVTITVYAWSRLRDRVVSVCTAELAMLEETVTLDRPLGDRELQGCDPSQPDSQSRDRSGPAEDEPCRDTSRVERLIGRLP